MDTSDKLKALSETKRDIKRDILRIERQLGGVESMTNPAQSQKEYNEIIGELQNRIVVIEEIEKDIKGLDYMKNFLSLKTETLLKEEKQPESNGEEQTEEQTEE